MREKMISQGPIEQKIFMIRGQKVMLDRDLAELYGVPTKVLNQAVKRNIERFPPEFMFKLTKKERDEVVTICDHLHALKFSYQMPLAFSEHGVAMLSCALNSARAIHVSIQIIKTFVRLREMVSAHKKLVGKLEELERKIVSHDAQIQTIFNAIHQLMAPPQAPPEPPRKKIGFVEERKGRYIARVRKVSG